MLAQAPNLLYSASSQSLRHFRSSFTSKISQASNKVPRLSLLSRATASRSMTSFAAWRVHEDPSTGAFEGREEVLSTTTLTPPRGVDEDQCVLIQVQHSALNYKDALSASGNPGVTRKFPHTPGIDAVGIRVDTQTPVLVTGYDLGMNTNGGYGEYISVPTNWIVDPVPFADPKTAMIYGTAGLTAGLCVQKLLERGKTQPADGKVLVTGATGAVGSVAVELLATLGFEVVAVTGKVDSHRQQLMELGASEVVGRETLEASKKPMLKALFAHGIDTVGGAPLAELLKQVKPGGSVACCGLVAGPQLETTVLPFILRGVQLLGVDSVEIPLADKKEVWQKLATTWKCPKTEASAKEIGRHELDTHLKAFLKGQSTGKIVLTHSLTKQSSL